MKAPGGVYLLQKYPIVGANLFLAWQYFLCKHVIVHKYLVRGPLIVEDSFLAKLHDLGEYNIFSKYVGFASLFSKSV